MLNKQLDIMMMLKTTPMYQFFKVKQKKRLSKHIKRKLKTQMIQKSLKMPWLKKPVMKFVVKIKKRRLFLMKVKVLSTNLNMVFARLIV